MVLEDRSQIQQLKFFAFILLKIYEHEIRIAKYKLI